MVGSTAFKAKAVAGGDKLYPEWVGRFREFYRQFPEFLDSAYRETVSGTSGDGRLKLWKIIGDEILFCCRVSSIQHLSCCVNAFINALERYGATLVGTGLDVKGAGWVADFPAKNVTLSITDGSIEFNLANEDLPTEAFEKKADNSPHGFDFLGTAIDIGFRVAEHAQADKFAASAELALVLADAKDQQMFMREFRYDGRLALKGVNGNHPYPVVFVDTERDHGKREIRVRERMVTQEPAIEAVPLRDFLRSYLTYHDFEPPLLPLRTTDPKPEAPASYEQYRKQWERDFEGARMQDESIQASETTGAPADGSNEVAILNKQKEALHRNIAQHRLWTEARLTERQREFLIKADEERISRALRGRKPKGLRDEDK